MILIDKFRERLSEIVSRKLDALSNIEIIRDEDNKPLPNPLLIVSKFILELKLDRRIYAMSDVVHVENLWEEIRENETLLDFTMELFTELRLYFSESDFKSLVSAISAAYDFGFSGDTVMDGDTLSRLPIKKNLSALLEADPWLVVIYLIPTLNIELIEVKAHK